MCHAFSSTYMDDILVFSKDETQHYHDLCTVLTILNDNDLRVSLDKCIFFADEVDFLGFNLSCAGMKPSSNKIDSINNFPEPNDTKSLRSFLGLINYYRHLVPNYANIVMPLSELARLNPSSKALSLSETKHQSFFNIREILSNVAELAHPKPSVSNFQLVTDTLQYAIGAALHQIIDNKPIPIGFFSKKLSQQQRKYSAFDRELLAAYMSVLHFKHLIIGRQITLFTDHRPLQSAFRCDKPPKSDRQQRHLSLISEYISDVQYIRGSDNIVADCLSRPAVNAVTIDFCDLEAIATNQETDDEINEYKEKLKPYKFKNDLHLWCDVSTPYPRPYVPQSDRPSILRSLHDISHPGIKATIYLVKSRYFWPNMDSYIKTYVRDCSSCQQSKVTRHTKSPIMPFSLPSERFQSVHIDIISLPPAKLSNELYTSPFKYLLTCIDRATRWIEVIPLVDISASNLAIAFLNAWISRFGVP